MTTIIYKKVSYVSEAVIDDFWYFYKHLHYYTDDYSRHYNFEQHKSKSLSGSLVINICINNTER